MGYLSRSSAFFEQPFEHQGLSAAFTWLLHSIGSKGPYTCCYGERTFVRTKVRVW